MPPTYERIVLEDSVDADIMKFWEQIQEGKRQPDGLAEIVDTALKRAILLESDRKDGKSLLRALGQTCPFFKGDPEIIRAYVSQILNSMYAKLEIFEMDLLPISPLESARSQLDGMSQLGHMRLGDFLSYASDLARSLEQFGKYIWKLENWPRKARKN
jgi:hypothetical protein